MESSPNPNASGLPPNLYQHLVEQVKDYAIFMLDPKGNVLTWNQGARRLKGYEGCEIIGNHFSVFFTKDDLDHDKPRYELKMATELGKYEEEGWRVRKDKTLFWANVVITALRDEEGNLTGFAKVTRDLTARKLQEDQFQTLLESEERFRLLVDQVKDYAIFLLDPRGQIKSWNQGAQRVKGYSPEEIIGQHFSIFYPEEDKVNDKPGKELALAIREGKYEEEGWRVRKDKSLFWANVVITALWDKRGNLTGFAKVTKDLTPRLKQDEMMRQRNRELEEIAHTIAHDIRAPLRAIISYSDVLLADYRQDISADALHFVERIAKNGHLMEELVMGVMRYSQVVTGVFEMEPIPLSDTFTEVLMIHESDIERTHAQITIAPHLPIVTGNRTLLLQLFSNLVGNALKFVREGRNPEVQVTCEDQSGEAQLLVQDNGIGVPEENLSRMFNVFERLDAARGNISGTGVGLAIVKRAVERLGGKIEVSSVLGEGTKFAVTLPLYKAEVVAV